MGQKDLAGKTLLGHVDVFADSVNALMYRGDECLNVGDLMAAPTETIYPDGTGELNNQFQDVSKYVMCGGDIRVQYTLENQTSADKEMVLRKAGYQGAIYRGQYREKESYPVIGAVLYWGKGHWNYPRNLKAFMLEKLSEREMDYVDDVHLDVYEMAHLPKDVRERFKSDMRIVVDYLAEGKYNPTNQKLVHAEDVLRMLREISDDDRYFDMIQKLTEEDKKEGISMCELLDRYWNGGVAEGINQGIVCSVRGMWLHDFNAEQIAMFINQKLDYVRKIIWLLGEYPEADDEAIAKRLLEEKSR